jgi:predicted nucleic acid-binding Zn ribbon protein
MSEEENWRDKPWVFKEKHCIFCEKPIDEKHYFHAECSLKYQRDNM